MVRRPLSGWMRLWLISIVPVSAVSFVVFVSEISPPTRPDGLCTPSDQEVAERDLLINRGVIPASEADDYPEARPCTEDEQAQRQNQYTLALMTFPAVLCAWLALCNAVPVFLFVIIRWVWRGFRQSR